MIAGQLDTKQEIEALIARKDATGEAYTPEDKVLIRQYEGGGGIKGATGEGVLTEFYTPAYLCAIMWELAYFHGFQRGDKVLEPSCATGRLLEDAPKESPLFAFEVNPISYRITQILHPRATIYNDYFETAFLKSPRFTERVKTSWLGEDFGLIIGNPPYGIHKNLYSGYFKSDKMLQMENFFMFYGLKLLKPGGLIVYLTSSNFLRNGDKFQQIKEKMDAYCTLADAYRLPPVFKNSKVPVDIIILRKK